MKKYKLHVVWAAIAIVALGGGFFWGKSVASSGIAGRGGNFAALGSSTRRAARRVAVDSSRGK